MSARLEAALRDRRGGTDPGGAPREPGLAPYVTAGDGGLARTRRVLHGLEAAGATAVELGVPFSDPIADGPVLQAAAQRALDAGTTLEGVFECVAAYRAEGGRLPLLLFTYLNPLLAGGLDASLARWAAVGGDGVLVPDLPLEESDALRARCAALDLAPVGFVTPTTGPERLARIAAASRGFLYAIGRVGITGARTELGPEALAFLGRARDAAGDLPLAVGFGLRTRDQVRALAGAAELAVVGTALVERLHAAAAGGDAAVERAARTYLGELLGAPANDPGPPADRTPRTDPEARRTGARP